MLLVLTAIGVLYVKTIERADCEENKMINLQGYNRTSHFSQLCSIFSAFALAIFVGWDRLLREKLGSSFMAPTYDMLWSSIATGTLLGSFVLCRSRRGPIKLRDSVPVCYPRRNRWRLLRRVCFGSDAICYSSLCRVDMAHVLVCICPSCDLRDLCSNVFFYAAAQRRYAFVIINTNLIESHKC